MVAISATATITMTMTVALFCIRATDTFSAFFLFSDKIKNDRSNQYNQYSCYNKVLHNYTPKAYVAFIFLFVL